MRFVERWIPLLAAVLAMSGCIKVDQTLSLNPDGSGTLEMVYGMSEQTIAQLEAMEQMAAGMNQEGMEVEVESDSPLDFDEEEIRKQFAEEQLQGVELLEVSSQSREGWKYMQVKMAFDDLASLEKTEFFEDSGLRMTRNAEGNYVLAQRLGSADMDMPGSQSGPGGGSGMDEQMMQGMASMFAGLRVVMTVVAPGQVIESNATQVEGNRASWIYDIDEDPQILSKLGGREEMRLVFSGEGLDLTIPDEPSKQEDAPSAEQHQ